MLALKLKNKLGNKGDTIVEVLIAIAVVSSVLGITYSIMNSNILTTRDNQERSEASKIAQGQLELLRNLWFKESEAKFNLETSGVFCITGDLSTHNVSDKNILVEGTPGYPSQCKVNNIYFVSMEANPDLSLDYSYTVTVKWDKVGGGTSEVVMAYKVK